MKKLTIIFFTAIILFSFACEKSASFKTVNTDSNNLAIKGFDSVAYFSQGAVQGNPQYEFTWNGAKWQFANAENLEKFKQNPEQFAPQFGGYCSWAVSHGYTADGDPNAWKIVNGKLYLNYNQKVKEKWEAEQDKFITDGIKNWEEFKTKPPQKKG